MPKKITHRFEIDGQTFKRESATRRYTHVIVSQYTQADKDRDIRRARKDLATTEARSADEDRLLRYATDAVKRGFNDGRSLEEEIAYIRQLDQGDVTRRREWLAKIEAAPIGAWTAEGWSQSARNAEKAADKARKHNTVVRVHEVTDVVEHEVKPRGRATKPGRVTKKQLELLREIDARGDEAYFGCVYGRAVPGLYRNGLVEDGEKVFLPNKTGTGGRHTHRLIITAKGRAALNGAK